MAFNLQVVTPAAFEPVTLAEQKAHSRVSITADDAYLTGLLTAARELAEKDLNSPLSLVEFDLFTEEDFLRLRYEFPRQPLVSVTSVKYTDGAGQEQTINAANYTVKPHLDPPELEFVETFVQPNDVNGVVIRFKAGYPDADSVPALLKHAVKFLADHWYERRAAVSEAKLMPVPAGYERIVSKHRVKRFQ